MRRSARRPSASTGDVMRRHTPAGSSKIGTDAGIHEITEKVLFLDQAAFTVLFSELEAVQTEACLRRRAPISARITTWRPISRRNPPSGGSVSLHSRRDSLPGDPKKPCGDRSDRRFTVASGRVEAHRSDIVIICDGSIDVLVNRLRHRREGRPVFRHGHLPRNDVRVPTWRGCSGILLELDHGSIWRRSSLVLRWKEKKAWKLLPTCALKTGTCPDPMGGP